MGEIKPIYKGRTDRMKIETKFFGIQEVKEENIITFEHGIPGFENFHKFVISNYNDNGPFLGMQSMEKADLAFILIALENIVPGYNIDLSNEVVAEIKLEKPEDAVLVAIVNIPDDLAKATVNLAAPIVVNSKTKIGKQIILNNPAYGLKHPLFTKGEIDQAEPKSVVK
jgi:flagellar assembly factor FliW